MISHVTDFPIIEADFRCAPDLLSGDSICVDIRVQSNGLKLRSSSMNVSPATPHDKSLFEEFNRVSWEMMRIQRVVDRWKWRNPEPELFDYAKPPMNYKRGKHDVSYIEGVLAHGRASNAHKEKMRDFYKRIDSRYVPLQLREGGLREQIEKSETLRSIPPESLLVPLQTGRASGTRYFLYQRRLWSSTRRLPSERYIQLMDDYLEDRSADHPVEDLRRIPQNVRDAVWRRDKGQCCKCGSRLRLEFDHIVPVSKGGNNSIRNIELLCELCNRRKKNKIG